MKGFSRSVATTYLVDLVRVMIIIGVVIEEHER